MDARLGARPYERERRGGQPDRPDHGQADPVAGHETTDGGPGNHGSDALRGDEEPGRGLVSVEDLHRHGRDERDERRRQQRVEAHDREARPQARFGSHVAPAAEDGPPERLDGRLRSRSG